MGAAPASSTRGVWHVHVEAGIDGAVPTGHDPLRDAPPELARTLAASVQQRIAFGE